MPTKPPEEVFELGIVGYITYQLVSRISEPSTVSVGKPSAGEVFQVLDRENTTILWGYTS